MQVRKGYIRNPWSKEHDGMHVSTVIQKIEIEAHRGCGMHYEIYQKRCNEALLEVITRLNDEDRNLLLIEASYRGHHIDEISLKESDIAYHGLMSGLIKEQI
ncbi:hypothetical protein HP459_20340 [Enterobacter sp. CM29]|uniref:hypothetical protein n=1 Tax=Enterobacter sp. CM29 TaxID=2738449 RepID=UPI0015C54F54|nr:hypothetical protein [Enterobacter sp. CM29]NQD63727.1 hypothetical protein [Enterobacter sp. CM29]